MSLDCQPAAEKHTPRQDLTRFVEAAFRWIDSDFTTPRAIRELCEAINEIRYPGDHERTPKEIVDAVAPAHGDLLAALEPFAAKDHGHTMSTPRETCIYCAARAALTKARR